MNTWLSSSLATKKPGFRYGCNFVSVEVARAVKGSARRHISTKAVETTPPNVRHQDDDDFNKKDADDMRTIELSFHHHEHVSQKTSRDAMNDHFKPTSPTSGRRLACKAPLSQPLHKIHLARLLLNSLSQSLFAWCLDLRTRLQLWPRTKARGVSDPFWTQRVLDSEGQPAIHPSTSGEKCAEKKAHPGTQNVRKQTTRRALENENELPSRGSLNTAALRQQKTTRSTRTGSSPSVRTS
ncbi:hypothetical protein C0Q70_20483 [Pomacea canaliculata]|uniref:Uncharacterized protein n=1 Tax=Pomacea canaliculata TaxID=400727 RepID=A0A2T7NFN8_POMCA|nr:hypothetical protein C0Q70_20483 [Pomacea canaliculata]